MWLLTSDKILESYIWLTKQNSPNKENNLFPLNKYKMRTRIFFLKPNLFIQDLHALDVTSETMTLTERPELQYNQYKHE